MHYEEAICLPEIGLSGILSATYTPLTNICLPTNRLKAASTNATKDPKSYKSIRYQIDWWIIKNAASEYRCHQTTS